MKISDFVQHIQSDSRKRTGIVLADDQYGQIVKAFEQANVTVVDCAGLYEQHVLLTDDQLIRKITQAGGSKQTLLLNLELFIAPRMRDGILELFAPKMVAEEPRHALIILLYSSKVFKKIDQFYQRAPLAQSHTLDLLEEDFS